MKSAAKVGVLLGPDTVPDYIYESLVFFRERGLVTIVLIQNVNTHLSTNSILPRLSFKRIIDRVFFKAVCWVEHLLLSLFKVTQRRPVSQRNILNIGDKIIQIRPIFSKKGIAVRYGEKDVKKIQNLDLDFIIRGSAPGIFKGEILRSAKHGIISFHHGDNRWNRGGPPGFWEVYLKKPATGFILQRLTEELDNGEVLARGEILTSSTYTENRQRLLRDSQMLLRGLLEDFFTNNEFTQPEPPFKVPPKIFKIPTPVQTLLYIYKTLSYFYSGFIRRHIFRKRQRWCVGFLSRKYPEHSVSRPTTIENPPGRFFADPFVVQRHGRTICYVEDYCFLNERGQISAIELFPDQTYNVLGPVITENFHLSFPFTFEFNNDLYMVPETRAAQAIKLYRCTDFPLVWEFQSDLMESISAVDSIIFQKDGLWWLLTTIESLSGDSWSNLHVFFSDSPVSANWRAHPCNPVVSEVDRARNGGMLNTHSGVPVRVRQKHGFRLYGKSITVAALDSLTTSAFSESEIPLKADWLPVESEGFHHMHNAGGFTAFDFLRFERPT